jgi:hypothetical protein
MPTAGHAVVRALLDNGGERAGSAGVLTRARPA